MLSDIDQDLLIIVRQRPDWTIDNSRCISTRNILEQPRPAPKSTTSSDKIRLDSQPSPGTCESKLSRILRTPSKEPEIEIHDAIHNAIPQAFREQLFASLGFEEDLNLDGRVRYHTVNKMGHKLKHCKRISHRLSEAQEQSQVTPSACLTELLCLVQHPGRKYIFTLDEA
jgi:hypothetical protein